MVDDLGDNGFPFWEIDRDQNNLEKMFPTDPMMSSVNRLLRKCVVLEEDCVPRAHGMLDEIDNLIAQAQCRTQRPNIGGRWPCRICGRGQYTEAQFVRGAGFPFTPHVCD